jgi:hypothetical protein
MVGCIDFASYVNFYPQTTGGTTSSESNATLVAQTSNVLNNPLYEDPVDAALRSFTTAGGSLSWGVCFWNLQGTEGSIFNSLYTGTYPTAGDNAEVFSLAFSGSDETQIVKIPTDVTDFIITSYFPFTANADTANGALPLGNYSLRQDYIAARSVFHKQYIKPEQRYLVPLDHAHVGSRIAVYIDTVKIPSEILLYGPDSTIAIKDADFKQSLKYYLKTDSFDYPRDVDGLPLFDTVLPLRHYSKLTLGKLADEATHSGHLFLSTILCPLDLAGKTLTFYVRSRDAVLDAEGKYASQDSSTFNFQLPSTALVDGAVKNDVSKTLRNTIAFFRLTPTWANGEMVVDFNVETNPEWLNEWDIWEINEIDGILVPVTPQ